VILRDDRPGPPGNSGAPMSSTRGRRYNKERKDKDTAPEGGTMSDKAFTTCLWFDTEAEEAANFYTGIFKDSKLGRILRHTEAGPGPVGSVLLVEFELNGNKFSALNGGPQFKFNEAVSVVVPCADQAEVDYYWSHLSEGGQEIACGWVKDKYGLCWQIVPTVFFDMVTDPDQDKAARVTRAMLQMTKLDVAALEQAYAAG
jgi:predicted 3-demethylubiquinone-9 3-methyltransferase (glyoxalase superfamily)